MKSAIGESAKTENSETSPTYPPLLCLYTTISIRAGSHSVLLIILPVLTQWKHKINHSKERKERREEERKRKGRREVGNEVLAIFFF